MMRAAKLSSSPRLQRTLRALQRAYPAWLSTRGLMEQAEVCAVSSCVSELRANGRPVDSRCVVERGRRVWLYRLAPAQGDLL